MITKTTGIALFVAAAVLLTSSKNASAALISPVSSVASDTEATGFGNGSAIVDGLYGGNGGVDPINAYGTTETKTPSFELDLGGNFDIDTFYYWGDTFVETFPQGAENFTLTFRDATNVNVVGTHSDTAVNLDWTNQQTFNLTTTVSNARFVTFQVDSSYGGTFVSHVTGEVAFNAITAPEPSTFVIAAICLLGLCVRRRRTRR